MGPTSPWMLKPLSAALQVVARYREHGVYGTRPRLLQAIKRRLPGSSPEERIALLERASAVYDAAVTVAAEHVPELWAARTGGPLIIPAPIREKLRALAPGESDEDYDETLSWVFWVYHIR